MFSNLEAIGLCCVRIPNGYSWTLVSQLSDLLDEAERLYGPRDKNWTPLGIEYCDGTPRIWYPGDRGHVAIQLTDAARADPNRALFQLAHEVIHLLAPLGTKQSLRIEEGLATYFSHVVSARYRLSLINKDPIYVEAERDVVELLNLSSDSIRRAREQEISFNNFTPELILNVCPTSSSALAERLCLPFQYAE